MPSGVGCPEELCGPRTLSQFGTAGYREVFNLTPAVVTKHAQPRLNADTDIVEKHQEEDRSKNRIKGIVEIQDSHVNLFALVDR